MVEREIKIIDLSLFLTSVLSGREVGTGAGGTAEINIFEILPWIYKVYGIPLLNFSFLNFQT